MSYKKTSPLAQPYLGHNKERVGEFAHQIPGATSNCPTEINAITFIADLVYLYVFGM